MGHPAGRDEFIPKYPLGAEGQTIARGFAVYDVARAARLASGMVGAGRVALFADYEEQAEVAVAGFEQRLGGLDHGGDDALGVASAAAPDVSVVFTRGDEWRHRVHVGGEGNDQRVAEADEDVVAAGFD